MNRTRELPVIRSVVLAIGLSLAAPLQAGLFDDFNFTLGSIIEDATSNASGVTGARGTGGTLANGWTRDALFANLIAGDRVEQADCSNCKVGHFNNDPNSVGNGYESWKLASGLRDFSNTKWLIDYGLDVAGLDVVMYFYNSQTDTISGEIWWKDIAATGVPGTPGTLSGALGGAVLADHIFIEEFSVGGAYDPSSAANYGGHLGARNFGIASIAADFNKDNLRIPEPSTLMLLGVGVGALGLVHRRAV